jgi:hypothetical protein
MAEAHAGGGRLARAVLGGWVLLSNPSPHALHAPATEWDDVGGYDTAFECETARREEAIEQAARQVKGGKPTEHAALDAMLRYRCTYTKHQQPRWRRWVRKAVGRLKLAGRSAR